MLRVSHEDRADSRDCLGNRPDSQHVGVRVDSRFTVAAGDLRCLGANTQTGAQTVIDGVEDFQVHYGLRGGEGPGARWAYVDASAVGDRWADVRA
ncbi:MAG TPA: PilW family protein, partial [Verrucomicrobiota bacterium]|nr:PilW family protein [Verrucomicrobiota bacterium]